DYQLSGDWAALSGLPTHEGKLRLIKALIAHGANLNAPLAKFPPRISNSIFPAQRLLGATPFFLAAAAADRDVMQLLRAAGADVAIRARNQATPLIGASGGFLRVDYETKIPESEVLATVKSLLETGSD